MKKLKLTLIIFTLIVLIVGCAPKIEKIPRIPEVREKKLKEYSLSEVQKDSLLALAEGEIGVFEGDPILAQLEVFKERELVKAIRIPEIMIIEPEEGAFLKGRVDVKCSIKNVKDVEEVRFYVDGVLRQTVKTSPFQWSWDTNVETKTSHTLKVVAKSKVGETQDTVNVYVVVEGSMGFPSTNYTSANGNVKAVTYYDVSSAQYLTGLLAQTYSTTATLTYTFTPPHPNSYLSGAIDVKGELISGDEPTYKIYNWSTERYESEVYDPKARAYTGSYGSGTAFQFPYFQPKQNKVKIKIEIPPFTTYRFEDLNFSYQYVYDKKAPTVSSLFTDFTLIADESPNAVRFFYNLSENSFVKIKIYNRSGKLVTTIKRTDWIGFQYSDYWNIPKGYSSSDLKFKVEVQDSAGYTGSSKTYYLSQVATGFPKEWQTLEGTLVIPLSSYSEARGSIKLKTFYDEEVGGTKQALEIGSNASPAQVCFTFYPPHPFNYSIGNVPIEGKILSGEEPTFEIFDWASEKFVEKVEDVEEGGSVDFGPEVPFGFQYFEPGGNRVKIKIKLPPYSLYRIESMRLYYKCYYDKTPPSISRVSNAYSLETREYLPIVNFYYELSENSFVKIKIYDSSNNLVKTISEAKGKYYQSSSWKVPKGYSLSNLKFKIEVRDSTGFSATSLTYPFGQFALTLPEEGAPNLLPFFESTPGAIETTSSLISAWSYTGYSGNVRKVVYYDQPHYSATLIGPDEATSSVTYAFKVNPPAFSSKAFKMIFNKDAAIPKVTVEGEAIYTPEGKSVSYSVYNYLTERFDYNLYDWIESREKDSVLDEEIYKEPYSSGANLPIVYVDPKTKTFKVRIEVPPRMIYRIKDSGGALAIKVDYTCEFDTELPWVEKVSVSDIVPNDGKVEIRYLLSEDAFVKIRVETARGSLVDTIKWADYQGIKAGSEFVYHYWKVPSPRYYGSYLRLRFDLTDLAGNEYTSDYYPVTIPFNP